MLEKEVNEMKKLVFLGALVLIAGGAALASSINVPWFNDSGDNNYPPTSGTSSFIAVHNTTNTDIVISVQYLTQNAAGDVLDRTTPGNYTALLKANSTMAWRPCASTQAEGPYKDSLPMVVGSDNLKWGSASIFWDKRVDNTPAEPTDVQGRLFSVSPANWGDSAMYTLPAGK
jgi:hypothetical protein